MGKRRKLISVVVFSIAILTSPSAIRGEAYDLVVYGGTAGGIVAAISAAREGVSVVILEPSSHVGGMVTGGLGRTDIGVSSTIGGMSAEFY